MTLCIAATCFDDSPNDHDTPSRYEINAAVVSYDTRMSQGNLQVDNAQKLVCLSPLWCCLIAGELSQGRAVARACARELLKDNVALDEDTITERVRAGAKHFAIRQHVAEGYGFTYDELLASKNHFARTIREKLAATVDSLSLPSQELIFVGWISDRFILVSYWDGQVYCEDNHLASGSGADHARMVLQTRGHKAFTRLDRVVYQAYEAQRVGSQARDVGSDARMSVLRFDKRLGCVSSASVQGGQGGFLDKTFLALAPKPMPHSYRLPSDLNERIIEAPWEQWPFCGKRGDGFDEDGQEIQEPHGKGEHGKQEAT